MEQLARGVIEAAPRGGGERKQILAVAVLDRRAGDAGRDRQRHVRGDFFRRRGESDGAGEVSPE